MKKLLVISLFTLHSSFFTPGYANPVTMQSAKTIAANFCSQTPGYKPVDSLTFSCGDYTNTGQPVYYVFDVNKDDGWVIVAADDAAHPILGYSTKGQFVIPCPKTNPGWWLNCRKEEIQVAIQKGIQATPGIANEWKQYGSQASSGSRESKTHSTMSSVNPLLQSAWNQSPYYNSMCPGGSVTGCVACAMAQIMRYWSYPAHGHGYYGYWQEQKDGFQENYGYLTADYDTSNYAWSSMPYSISSNNSEIGKLMYDCGVSVNMDYSPGESEAWVITGDYPLCSQAAYVKYFGYNKNTIQGVYTSNYTYTNWKMLIMNELNNSRPVQYVGNDSVNDAGHTWVCDGYTTGSDTLFDMNWGWGGSDNGNFALNALYVSSYDFGWWDEAVIGIQPPQVSAYFSASKTFGNANLSVTFYDSSISLSPITSYNWLFPGGNPNTSPSANPTIVYNNPGTYDVTEIVSDGIGTDTIVRKAYISVASTAPLPLAQGFQSSDFPPTGWVINNPLGFNYTWALNSTVGGYGASTQSMYFNNTQIVWDFYTIYTGLWVNPPGKPAIDVLGERQQIYSPEYNFTGVINPTLYFDVAYAPYNTSFSDTLNVYYSIDSGKTFHSVYSKGGMTLCTTGNMVTTGADTNSNGIFVPLSNNWRTDTIHIPAIAGVSSVMFSYENVSGNGAAMYIDNITIPGVATNVQNVSAKPSVSVYPNPTSGQFDVQLSGYSGQWSVEVYNVIGEKVYSLPITSGTTFNIDLSAQSSGVYLVRILSSDGTLISQEKVLKSE